MTTRSVEWDWIAESDERYILAEGPQWDAATNSFSWVDIEGRALMVAEVGRDRAIAVRETWHFDERVTFAHPLGEGRYLIGLGRRLAVSTSVGVTEVSRELVPAGRRLNDAAIDPQGRLIVGGMSLEGDHARNVLLRIETDGAVTRIDDDLGLSNGIGFSPDGTVLYSTDSTNGVVYARSYSDGGAVVGERHPFARFTDVEPDGMMVDADGRLWIALWGGGGINVYEPRGALVASLAVPATHVSSVQLGGIEPLAIVTTSMLLLDEVERIENRHAGRVSVYRTNATAQRKRQWIELPLSSVDAEFA